MQKIEKLTKLESSMGLIDLKLNELIDSHNQLLERVNKLEEPKQRPGCTIQPCNCDLGFIQEEEWPKNSYEYWIVDDEGDVLSSRWFEDDNICKGRKQFGNYFRTKEEAEFAASKIKELLTQLKK